MSLINISAYLTFFGSVSWIIPLLSIISLIKAFALLNDKPDLTLKTNGISAYDFLCEISSNGIVESL